jgi:hypothetical protein
MKPGPQAPVLGWRSSTMSPNPKKQVKEYRQWCDTRPTCVS